VPASAFQAWSAETPLERHELGYYYTPEAGTASAPLSLPAGARITVITCYFYDVDPSGVGLVELRRHTYNTSTDTPTTEQLSPALISMTTGGYHRVFESFDETVRYRPSAFTRRFYELSLSMGGQIRSGFGAAPSRGSGRSHQRPQRRRSPTCRSDTSTTSSSRRSRTPESPAAAAEVSTA
jgi:hypothetical protein